MTRCAAGARAGDAGGPENAVEGRPRDDEVPAIFQELAEVLEVHSRVGRPRQAHEALAKSIGQASGRRAAVIAVHERGGPPLAVGSAEALRLADGASQEGGGISHLKCSALEGVENHKTLCGLVRQGQHSPRIRLGRGVTFSLNA